MNIEKLKDPAFQQKLRDASSPEELLAIAAEEGYELSDAELDAVSGGNAWDDIWADCPDYCSSLDKLWQ
jgi:predicted ribosomally synthesized peptide with nif11-like leader